MDQKALRCHLCQSPDIQIHKLYSSVSKVSSDCKPSNFQGDLVTCNKCNTLQTSPTYEWQKVVEKIYAEYKPYFQSNGVEQVIHKSNSNKPLSRSCYLVNEFKSKGSIKVKGKLLDVGCGNGAFLKAFSKINTNWDLYGFDLNDIHKSEILSIKNVKSFFCKDLKDINEKFDLISLVHVLEHIPNPIKFLDDVRKLLTPNGKLLIQVPDWSQNVFILLVADHCSHFDQRTLYKVVLESGLSPIYITNQLIPKEITIFCTNSHTDLVDIPQVNSISPESSLEGIQKFLKDSKKFASSSTLLGIFGTSLSGSWLASELNYENSFFVDEDPNKIGSSFYDRKIISPEDIPSSATILIPLAKHISSNIKLQLNQKHHNLNIIIPNV
jgi:2-polyprenyl-3-methyl-5-hydroxy-6-metoxy-1,4-benzoquinol methylase